MNLRENPRENSTQPAGAHAVPADPVLTGVYESALADVAFVNRESAITQLTALPNLGRPPYHFRGTFAGIEHFVRASDGTFRKCANPIPFEIEFEHDYCRSIDPRLQFRVLRTTPLLAHPNVTSGIVCLGTRFRPATPLRALVELFYRLASGRLAATDDPFDRAAAEFFLSNPDAVRALVAPPLWRRPIARSARVITHAQAQTQTQAHTQAHTQALAAGVAEEVAP